MKNALNKFKTPAGVLIVQTAVLVAIVSVVLFVTKGENNTSNINGDNTAVLSRDCTALTPENPYPEGTGEYAGFEWSMLDRGSRDCEAYNEPFIVGCMEFVNQENNYNECVYEQTGVKKDVKTVKPILLSCEEGQEVSDYCLEDF